MSDSHIIAHNVTMHAYLSNVLLTYDAESTDSDKIHLEVVVIPNKLRIRRVRKEDLDRTRKRATRPFEIHFPPDERIIIECTLDSTDFYDGSKTVIDRTLLALRLFKKGSPFVVSNYRYLENEDGFVDTTSYLAVPHPLDRFNPLYSLDVSESKKLQTIFESLRYINFDKETSFRIASERFSRSYYDIFYEDKLIDLCIGFEALFYKEKTHSRQSMGNRIGSLCANQIDKDHTIQNEIKSNLQNAFTLRNKIVHGSDFDWDEVYRLTPILEEYLRKSLVLLVSKNVL